MAGEEEAGSQPLFLPGGLPGGGGALGRSAPKPLKPRMPINKLSKNMYRDSTG